MKTEIIKIDVYDSNLDEKLLPAANIIKSGGLVVFPTETVYGLGADALSAEAARKIYEAKGRPSDNPLIIHISKPREAEKYTYTNKTFELLAKAFMPGPLTVVLPAKDIVPKQTRASLPTVAVRCPSNPIARRLIELSGVPIAAPSANLSGSPSATKASHVIDDMSGRVDIIIDGGDSDIGLESTIVKIDDDGSVTLLRPGKITTDELSAIVGEIKIADAVTNKLKDGEAPQSPGMKYRHYAPKAPLYLIEGDKECILEFISKKAAKKKIAVICYTDDVLAINSVASNAAVFPFGKEGDELSQAHFLFDILREADKHDFDEIYAPLPQAEGVGLALYNRMIRAAAYQIIRM